MNLFFGILNMIFGATMILIGEKVYWPFEGYHSGRMESKRKFFLYSGIFLFVVGFFKVIFG